LEFYEAKDLLGKSVYDRRGQKIGEVEKAVFLKDGKGALLFKNTGRSILMEQVQSVADIILVAPLKEEIGETSTGTPVTPLAPTSPSSPKTEQNVTHPQPSAEVPTPPVKVPATQPVTTSTCPKCKHENKLSAKFCVKCGERLGASQTMSEEQRKH
jgi:sporulation protein YlmC with PRC-barrel domain